MTGFHDVRFPDAIARGAIGGPEFSTDVIAVASGYEQRNVNWSAARAKFDISTGIRTREQMAEVIAFFRARRGRAYGFRFRDWNDFDATGEALASDGGSLDLAAAQAIRLRSLVGTAHHHETGNRDRRRAR